MPIPSICVAQFGLGYVGTREVVGALCDSFITALRQPPHHVHQPEDGDGVGGRNKVAVPLAWGVSYCFIL